MGRKPRLQDKILTWLARNGPARFTTIAKALNLKSYPLTYALNKLIEQGLITQVVSDGQVVYQLTRSFFDAKMRDILENLIAQQKISVLQYENPILQVGNFNLSDKTWLAIERALEENEQFGIILFNPKDVKNIQDVLKWNIIDKFNSWHKALNEGWLNHRTYLHTHAQKLSRKILQYVKAASSQQNLANELNPLLKEKLDPVEPWTIGDIIRMHPFGRSVEFWESILQKCMEIKPV